MIEWSPLLFDILWKHEWDMNFPQIDPSKLVHVDVQEIFHKSCEFFANNRFTFFAQSQPIKISLVLFKIKQRGKNRQWHWHLTIKCQRGLLNTIANVPKNVYSSQILHWICGCPYWSAHPNINESQAIRNVVLVFIIPQDYSNITNIECKL